VGILSGSSDGPIRFDARGPRAKPDIVVPVSTTSEAAGAVSGAAALIRSEAKARHMNVNELTTKALLMAGAQHPQDWQRGTAGSFDDVKVPLDYRYGAGSLRVDNSFDILVAGQHPQGGSDTGWDAGMARKKNKFYQFNVADTAGGEEDEHGDSFMAMLAWNRDVKRNGRVYSASLADLEMSLSVKSGRKWVKVSRSDSDFDNVESITLNDIAPGTYRLSVRGDRQEAYSLAWMTSEQDDHSGGGSNSGPGSTDSMSALSSGEISPTAVPEPGLMGLVVVAMGMLGRRRR
jgi:hypothetical protein